MIDEVCPFRFFALALAMLLVCAGLAALAQAGVTRMGGDAQTGSVAAGDSTRSSLEDAPND